MNTNNVFLKANEGRVLALALLDFIELQRECQTNPKINWTPQARKES
jgi:hypothetical protein